MGRGFSWRQVCWGRGCSSFKTKGEALCSKYSVEDLNVNGEGDERMSRKVG